MRGEDAQHQGCVRDVDQSTFRLFLSHYLADNKDISKNERKQKINEDFQELSQHLSKFFNAQVQFRVNENGKGKIVIPFDNTEEMERIIGILDQHKG